MNQLNKKIHFGSLIVAFILLILGLFYIPLGSLGALIFGVNLIYQGVIAKKEKKIVKVSDVLFILIVIFIMVYAIYLGYTNL
ncbi:MFS superfamily sulfate permease-like transporter [Cytobacillus horneckiae]|uniref:hypothetical protein n=1 Tax=Cytobacillus horneckiae TaxID=549687 RepID=UPI0019D17AC9|nr:hypothetical protein [Cytobacillus horneckiae]MBN6886256.1 hypothetical protein [Cytobacillus horneckiae]